MKSIILLSILFLLLSSEVKSDIVPVDIEAVNFASEGLSEPDNQGNYNLVPVRTGVLNMEEHDMIEADFDLNNLRGICIPADLIAPLLLFFIAYIIIFKF